MSDFAVAVRCPWDQSQTFPASPEAEQVQEQHTRISGTFLALWSRSAWAQGFGCRQEWDDLGPAWVDVSGTWTTSSFPDMLLHFRDAASCIYHWVESLTRLQMCKSRFLNCCVTFCSEQLGSEAVPGTTARLFRAWVSTRLVIRVSQIEGYLLAPLSNAESTEYLIQIFVLLVWQLREMLINNINVKMCVSLLIIIHWPFLWTMSYIRYSPRVSSCGCDYYINPLGNLSWCSHEFSSHGQVDECFQSKSCKVKVTSKSCIPNQGPNQIRGFKKLEAQFFRKIIIL